MRKLINLIALLIMASSVTWAQDKKSFTLEDLMPGGNNYYNPVSYTHLTLPTIA